MDQPTTPNRVQVFFVCFYFTFLCVLSLRSTPLCRVFYESFLQAEFQEYRHRVTSSQAQSSQAVASRTRSALARQPSVINNNDHVFTVPFPPNSNNSRQSVLRKCLNKPKNGDVIVNTLFAGSSVSREVSLAPSTASTHDTSRMASKFYVHFFSQWFHSCFVLKVWNVKESTSLL